MEGGALRLACLAALHDDLAVALIGVFAMTVTGGLSSAGVGGALGCAANFVLSIVSFYL